MPRRLPADGSREVVLVDSSVWIDHFARPNEILRGLLNLRQITTHVYVIGELALGSLGDRAAKLRELNALPRVAAATTSEVAAFIEWARLYGTGIGYVDAHLLAAVRLNAGVSLWTRDRHLRVQAQRLDLMLHG